MKKNLRCFSYGRGRRTPTFLMIDSMAIARWTGVAVEPRVKSTICLKVVRVSLGTRGDVAAYLVHRHVDGSILHDPQRGQVDLDTSIQVLSSTVVNMILSDDRDEDVLDGSLRERQILGAVLATDRGGRTWDASGPLVRACRRRAISSWIGRDRRGSRGYGRGRYWSRWVI